MEECELADAIARGDKDARTRMIQANLRLVVKIARDYMGRGMGLDDLIGEGNLGLIRATEEFEPRFGTRFSTYASYWIKQSIRHALINTSTTIRLPAHMVGLLTKWRRAERALCRQLGRGASFNEVADELGLSESQKMLVAKAHQARQLKLENNISAPARRGLIVGSVSANTRQPMRCWKPTTSGASCLIGWHRLEPRERTILTLRYGLEGESALTLKEIGRRLGVTREWVRKIEIRAVRKLHNEYAAEMSGQPARGSCASFRSGVSVRRKPRKASRAALRSARPARSPGQERELSRGFVRSAAESRRRRRSHRLSDAGSYAIAAGNKSRHAVNTRLCVRQQSAMISRQAGLCLAVSGPWMLQSL